MSNKKFPSGPPKVEGIDIDYVKVIDHEIFEPFREYRKKYYSIHGEKPKISLGSLKEEDILGSVKWYEVGDGRYPFYVRVKQWVKNLFRNKFYIKKKQTLTRTQQKVKERLYKRPKPVKDTSKTEDGLARFKSNPPQGPGWW